MLFERGTISSAFAAAEAFAGNCGKSSQFAIAAAMTYYLKIAAAASSASA